MAYDFDMVLNAAKIIQDQASDVEFVIQGGGELGSKIQSGISNLNLKNIVFMDKILQRDEVSKLLSNSDLLLLPLANFNGQYVGMSSKLYEYQAVAKPILCCANGVPADYVSETKSGVVIKPGDHKELAEKILFLKKNPDLVKKMGDKGRAYVEKNASIQQIGMQIQSLFVNSRSWQSIKPLVIWPYMQI